MDRMRSINQLFERGTGPSYTNDALLYQDILRFCLEQKQESVKITELSNWLLRNNRELVSYYDSSSTKRNTPYHTRVHAHRTKIENRINDLIVLRLLERSGTVKGDKNELQTTLYSYTKLGYLVALILRSSFIDKEIGYEKRKASINRMFIAKKEEELQNVNGKIFDLLDSTFFRADKDARSTVVFYSKFFRKCRGERAFDSLVRHIAEIAHSKSRLDDVKVLFERAMDLGLSEIRLREKFMRLWNETFQDLDEETKRLVLFQMKLDTERRFEDNKIFLTREYEETRFENRNDYERIVVEGECNKCKSSGPMVLSYLEYRKKYVGPGTPIQLACPKCYNANSLSVLSLN